LTHSVVLFSLKFPRLPAYYFITRSHLLVLVDRGPAQEAAECQQELQRDIDAEDRAAPGMVAVVLDTAVAVVDTAAAAVDTVPERSLLGDTAPNTAEDSLVSLAPCHYNNGQIYETHKTVHCKF